MSSTPSRSFASSIMGEDELVCSKPVSVIYPSALPNTRNPGNLNTSFDSSLSSTLVNSSSPGNTSTFLQYSPQVKEVIIHKQVKRRASLPDTRSLVTSPSILAFDLPAFLPEDVFADSIPSHVEPNVAAVFPRSYLQSPSIKTQGLSHIASIKSLAQPAQPQLASSVPAPPQPTPTCAAIISQLAQEALNHVSGCTSAPSSSSTTQLLSDMSAFLQTTMDTCKSLHARIQQEMVDHKVTLRGHDNRVGAKHINGTEGSARATSGGDIHGHRGATENQLPSLVHASSLLMSDADTSSAQRTSGRSAPFDLPLTSSQNNSTSGAPSCAGRLSESWDSIVAHAPWFTNYDDESNRRPAHVSVTQDNRLNTTMFAPRVERVAYPVQRLVEETHIHRYLSQENIPHNVDFLAHPCYNPWKSHHSQPFLPVYEDNLFMTRRPLPRYNPNPVQRSTPSPLPIACPRPSPVIPVREMEALLEMDYNLSETSRRIERNFVPVANTTYLPPPSNLYAAHRPFHQHPTRQGAYEGPSYSRFSPFSVDTMHYKRETKNSSGSYEESWGNPLVYEKPPHILRSTPAPNFVQRASNRPWEAPSPSALPNPPWPGMTPSPPAFITFPSTTALSSPLTHSPTDSGFSEGPNL